MSVLLQQLTELAEKAAVTEGCELVDVEYRKEGREWILRVLLDKPPKATGDAETSGITMAECGAVSDILSALLDVHDILPNAYRLEVSSPGLDRPLRKRSDYERFQGKLAVLRTGIDLDGQKRFKGRLRGMEEDHVLLETGTGIRRLPFDAITKANLEYEFTTGTSAKPTRAGRKAHGGEPSPGANPPDDRSQGG